MYYLEARGSKDNTDVYESKMVKDYMVISNVNRCLFTGDTLSIGGCDPKFLGNENRMLIAIDDIIKLPQDTKIMPG